MKTLIILALMIGLVPPKYQKEGEELARVRYQVIAAAISIESSEDRTLALFMITVARHESSFRLDIHSGSKRGAAGEAGLFQVMVENDPPHRVIGHTYTATEIMGTDLKSTRRAAEVAAAFLAPRIDKCNAEPLCVFASYGGVSRSSGGVVGKRLAARVATYERLRSK